MAPALLVTKPAPFKKLPKVSGSTIQPFVGALYEDRQGILWIGTPEALIRRDYKTGRITAYRTGGPEVGSDVVSICEDRSGNLWVGTYGQGLHRFDRRTGRQAIYTTLPSGTYTFRAQGATRGGPWSEPGVALCIENLPPWWDTWW